MTYKAFLNRFCKKGRAVQLTFKKHPLQAQFDYLVC